MVGITSWAAHSIAGNRAVSPSIRRDLLGFHHRRIPDCVRKLRLMAQTSPAATLGRVGLLSSPLDSLGRVDTDLLPAGNSPSGPVQPWSEMHHDKILAMKCAGASPSVLASAPHHVPYRRNLRRYPHRKGCRLRPLVGERTSSSSPKKRHQTADGTEELLLREGHMNVDAVISETFMRIRSIESHIFMLSELVRRLSWLRSGFCGINNDPVMFR